IVPMLKGKELVGSINIHGQEARPFTGKQIELLQGFAAQAVIAINNARLLGELRQRTGDLSEALEQQRAIAEALRVISASPAELQPVFKTILSKAHSLCGVPFGALLTYDGEFFRLAAERNLPAAWAEWVRKPLRPGPKHPVARIVAGE